MPPHPSLRTWVVSTPSPGPVCLSEIDLKRKSWSRHYASIMRMGFPKSRQFVELFEAPKGIPNDGSAPQGSSRKFVYPAETLYN
jgi:hypothetical protein